MDLQEFYFWLAKEMREKDVPKSAILAQATLPNCELDECELVYDREANTVTISQIKGAQQ